MTTQAWIALGSNLGDRKMHLAAAARSMARLGEMQYAAVYETAPQFPPGVAAEGGPFLNTVCLLLTQLNVLELFLSLRRIEDENLRTRTVPFAPRTLDLDLLAFGPLCLLRRGAAPPAPSSRLPMRHASFSLSLPHPRMHSRRFVLVPLMEIDPRWRHPLLGSRVDELLRRLGEGSPVKWHCAASGLFI